MKFFASLLALALSLTSALTAADLGALQTSFIARYDEVNTTRDDQLKKLQSSYTGALERHLEKTKASGELTQAIPVRDEIEAVKAGADPMPEIPDTADPELKSMRAKYVEARTKVTTTHAESLVSLADKMSVALEGEEKDLTRNGKLDEALAAKRMRETLNDDQGIANARKLLGSTAKADSIASAEPAEWKLLLKQRMKVEDEGKHSAGVLSKVGQEGRRFWRRMLTGGDESEADEILLTPGSCRLSFKPSSPVTEIRGTVNLAFPGASAKVRVKAGGKSIFEGELGGRDRSAKVDAKFDPTEELEIEVEQLGDADAWIYWSALEVR